MAQLYEISKEAEQDWRKIIEYTLKKFGELQVQKYTNDLINCLNDLANEIGYFKAINITKHKILIKHCNKHYIFALH